MELDPRERQFDHVAVPASHDAETEKEEEEEEEEDGGLKTTSSPVSRLSIVDLRF